VNEGCTAQGGDENERYFSVNPELDALGITFLVILNKCLNINNFAPDV
jgi:hypothetical protein